MDRIVIKQPDFSKIDPQEVFKLFTDRRQDFMDYFHAINEPRYLSWDKVRFRDAPAGFTKESAWYLAWQLRKLSSQETPISSEEVYLVTPRIN